MINIEKIIKELHKAFNFLNRDLFQNELSEPIIMIQSKGNRKLALSWCSVGKVWKNENTQEERYEINFVAEAINRGLIPVITTLLSEMVHLYSLENGIKDTSRGSTYNNKKFKAIAEKLGIVVSYNDKVGWRAVTLQQNVIDLINSYGLNEEIFSIERLETTEQKEKKKRNKSKRYRCPNCAVTISSLKEVNIICGDCNVPFELINPGFVCLDCGEVSNKISSACFSCNGVVVRIEEAERIIEEETELDDGSGRKIPVKQIKLV